MDAIGRRGPPGYWVADSGKARSFQLWVHSFARIKAKFLELARQNKSGAVRR
jgi:hypothetical protein